LCVSSEGPRSVFALRWSNPTIGETGKEETVEEYKVEILCADEENTKDAVRELKKAHPYEEVAYEVYKIEDF
jgi:hypothetical protein